MKNHIQELLERIKALEQELTEEIQRKEKEFAYQIKNRKVIFSSEAKRRHRQLMQSVRRFLYESRLLVIITAPVIWACLLPAVLLDIFITIYHAVCFPIYGIPKVRRRDYIVIDRHALRYLNIIEKLNCAYCGYVNGLIAYTREIAARTEQYWCPIKHARRTAAIHGRYHKFVEYGDAEGYRRRLAEIRRDFEDLKA
ncbi:hypothetical protein [Desulfurivibrio alkaliphilus]|uniref:Uncharacterized protein n=1 Tax=Desulfurivibrio alkaliphilus (strain DSM 19089 / UNIQEM U267 / AHT2) TaxID=589865 RepID=D6Z5D8_DESAT|nr:hypothetical protein [Desulfurivibrio alkaliphilus]ADH84795.1 conserved hypothetical protein [Desulfurivibrio alkaliphilus AHT 2]